MVNCCTVEILTRVAGSKSEFRADGRLEYRRDSVTVSYKQGADSVRLVAENGAFFMSRKGETELNMVFRSGGQTRAVLIAEGGEGSFDVYTKRYERRRLADGFCILLDYELRFPQNAELYYLEIFVKTDSEEK